MKNKKTIRYENKIDDEKNTTEKNNKNDKNDEKK